MKPVTRGVFVQQATFATMALVVNPLRAFPFAVAGKRRIGIIGLDSSHCTAFTKALNEDVTGELYKGWRVTAAYPFGSDRVAGSAQRISSNTTVMEAAGVRICSSIESVAGDSDAIMLLTNDGGMHLRQARQVFATRKPLFIDKPLAASFGDVAAIFREAHATGTPLFSCSSLRYLDGIEAVRTGVYGRFFGADIFSPAQLEPGHTGLFWYGIHGVEALYALMGAGCRSVSCVHTADTDVVTGTWTDGRTGVIRGTRTGKADFGGIAFCESSNVMLGPYKGYVPLLQQIAGFFETGTPPVPPSETIEIYAFMQAAQESAGRNGEAVAMQKILSTKIQVDE